MFACSAGLAQGAESTHEQSPQVQDRVAVPCELTGRVHDPQAGRAAQTAYTCKLETRLVAARSLGDSTLKAIEYKSKVPSQHRAPTWL